MNQIVKISNTVFLLVILVLFSGATYSQEIDLLSLSQLEDNNNSGKTIKINKSFNLKGATLNIADGITLKPFGGILSNGTIAGDGFIISPDKQNKTFDLSINFENKYPHPFFPEWYGARGDGSTNDTPAIEKAVSVADSIELKRFRTYFLEDPLVLDRVGTIQINGNGALIKASGFQTVPMITFTGQFSNVVIDNLSIDGTGQNSQAINVRSSFRATGLDIQNMYGDIGTTYGIRAEIRKNAFVSIKDSYINNVRAEGNGLIGDGKGASRAIIIDWYGSYPNTHAVIEGNTLKNIIGEDGDIIQIAQNSYDYINNSKTVIRNNYIAFGTRRLIKATASNIEIYGNTFETFPEGHPDSEPDPDGRTYKIGFQTFNGHDYGRNANYVLGARFEYNTFIAADSDIDYGNGATLGLQQTKGAIVRNNQFNNSSIAFNLYNQEALISNNTFTNSNITFIGNDEKARLTFNNTRIINNIGTFDCRAISREITGVVNIAKNHHLEGLVIDNNEFMVNDGCVYTDPNINKEIVFFSKDPGGLIESLIITNNTFTKGETYNNVPATNPFFLRTDRVNFDATSNISDNRIISESTNAWVGIRIQGEFPFFPFSYSNNILDIPNNGIPDDYLLTPNVAIPLTAN